VQQRIYEMIEKKVSVDVQVPQIFPTKKEEMFVHVTHPFPLFLVLFEFVDGNILRENTGGVVKEIAEFVAWIHMHTEEILKGIPEADWHLEEFKVNDLELDIERCVASLREKIISDDRPESIRFRRKLRKLFLEENERKLKHFLTIIERMKKLCTKAKLILKEKNRRVLCHCDIHGWNILRAKENRIYLLDFDGIRLSLAEHDIQALSGENTLDIFLSHYCKSTGKKPEIDDSIFDFLFVRRNIEDLIDWWVAIEFEDCSGEQCKHNFEGMLKECIAKWDTLGISQRQINILQKYSNKKK